MRTLNIVCAVAIVLTTLHLGHGMHHFFAEASPGDLQNPLFWTGLVTAAAVGILSLVGAFLLLKRKG
jgi:F0F1-type ATP synthase membrane subunit c/vacuolar-type H+-ATPase subunit K